MITLSLVPPNPKMCPPPLTPVKSMQRAVSSDTLSTMSFTDAQCHISAALHDAKPQLSHSQSMILPENGKVLAFRAHTNKVIHLVFSIHRHAEGNADVYQFHTKHWTYTHAEDCSSWWCLLPVFLLIHQCRDYSCNVSNIIVEPPSPESSPDSDGGTPVRKNIYFC